MHAPDRTAKAQPQSPGGLSSVAHPCDPVSHGQATQSEESIGKNRNTKNERHKARGLQRKVGKNIRSGTYVVLEPWILHCPLSRMASLPPRGPRALSWDGSLAIGTSVVRPFGGAAWQVGRHASAARWWHQTSHTRATRARTQTSCLTRTTISLPPPLIPSTRRYRGRGVVSAR
jgi:hypothetical protein